MTDAAPAATPVDAVKPREPWPWTDAEKTAMLKSVEGMIHAACRSLRRQRDHQLTDESAYEDGVQACRLQLWEQMHHFRPDGPAKFGTWAHRCIGFAVKRFQADCHAATFQGRTLNVEADHWAEMATYDPEYDDDAEDFGKVDPDELDATESYLAGVHRLAHADKLACLSPGLRAIVEAVVFDRLTLPQVADRLGHKLSIVENNFRTAVARLHDAGVFTAEQATAFGVTIRRPQEPKRFEGEERQRYEAALRSDRPAVEIAAEFGVKPERVNANRRAIAAGTYRRLPPPKPPREPKPRPSREPKPPREPKPKPPRELKPKRSVQCSNMGNRLTKRLAAEGRTQAYREALASAWSNSAVAAEFGVTKSAVQRRRARLRRAFAAPLSTADPQPAGASPHPT